MRRTVRSTVLLSGLVIMTVAAGVWLSGQRLTAQQPSGVPGPTKQDQVGGSPGSPSATRTINGEELPPPPQKFGGKIERNAAQSTPYWPMRVVLPKDAPNVLLIMTD